MSGTPTCTTGSGTTATGARAAFLYDDCCPLCRGYTGAFTALGWTDRQPFSQVEPTTLDGLDVDRARHQIPLVDPATGRVRYGLDGILGVVGSQLPALRPAFEAPIVRSSLDHLYWLITYNRRHIVAAPPPREGFDCGPDRNHRAIVAYLAMTASATVALVAASGMATAAAVASSAGLATAVTSRRQAVWSIDRLQAAGHVASVATAAALAGASAGAITRSPAVSAVVAAGVGARKTWLRRWMATDPS